MIYIKLFSHANLGNWLFQYAFALALSKKRGGDRIVFYATTQRDENRIGPYLPLFDEVEVVREIPMDVYYYLETAGANTSDKLYSQKSVLLDGFFQDLSLFDGEQVRTSVHCPESVKEIIQNKYGELLNQRTVGVSVRRGDYLKIPHAFPFVGEEFLTRAIDKFDKDCVFVVCSDDIPWCKRFFTTSRFQRRMFFFIEKEAVLTQLFIQAGCCDNVISNSTFSWWGAFLNPHLRKRTIFPSMWVGLGYKYKNPPIYWKGVEVIENRYTPIMWCKAVITNVVSNSKYKVRKLIRGY